MVSILAPKLILANKAMLSMNPNGTTINRASPK